MKWTGRTEKFEGFRWLHFLNVFVFAVLISLQSLEADVKLPQGLGPVATPVTVNVNRGEDLLIKLTASMKGSGGNFEFSIFEKPRNGQIVVQSLTGPFALVRYVSDPSSSSGIDQFRFRARSQNGKYSAPATVQINVLDDPLRLKVTEALDFGEVVVGQVRALELGVSNVSKYPLKGTFIFPKEFSLEIKKDNFTIGPEQSAQFRVKYNPEKVVGSFERKLFIKGEGISSSILLRGASVSAFKIKKKKISLEYSNESFLRSAEIFIENVSDSDIELELTDIDSDFIVRPNSVVLGEKESKKVIVEALNDNPSGISGSITVSSQFDAQKIELKSPPLPHRVIVNGGKNTIRINPVQGSPVKFEFEIENIGGGSVGATVNVPEGFRRLDGEGGVELGVKEGRTIQIEYDSKKEGPIHDYINVRWSGNVQNLIVKGDVSVRPGKQAPKNELSGSAKGVKRDVLSVNPDDYPFVKTIEKQREFDNELPRIEEITLKDKGKGSLVLGWEVPKALAGIDLGYVVETRVHRYDDESKSISFEWLELGPEYLMVNTNGPNVEAEVKGLSPDGKYTFRVFRQSKNGEVSPGSVPFQFRTESSFKFTRASWIYLMGVGGALLGIICYLIQRKKN